MAFLCLLAAAVTSRLLPSGELSLKNAITMQVLRALQLATRLSTVRVQCCTAVRGRRATLVLASEEDNGVGGRAHPFEPGRFRSQDVAVVVSNSGFIMSNTQPMATVSPSLRC